MPDSERVYQLSESVKSEIEFQTPEENTSYQFSQMKPSSKTEYKLDSLPDISESMGVDQIDKIEVDNNKSIKN